MFCSVVFSQLQAQFGQIEDEIGPIQLLDVVLVKLGGFFVVMGEGVGSAEIPDDSLVITSLLISLLVCDCCLFGLIDLDKSISINFEILEGGDSLYDLIVAFGIALPVFEVLQVDISQQFSTFNKIRRVSFDGLEDTHCLLDVP